MAESNRAKDIFLDALDLPSPDERAAFLEKECGADGSLRSQVEALLEAHMPDSSFLERPAAAMTPTIDQPPITERPGMAIGPYKLLQQIGEGGMGVVYMAEQQVPVRRKVALKIIKPGMDSGQVIARFEAERQALALMDHQNIARVLDAGTTESGRPYFVMELVHGIPITTFCDNSQLTPRQRLELFIPICHAIQHAHQKGIIHRDIKPSNILVTMYDDKPVPKVIDFGVAKAVEQRLTEKTLFTQFGALVGTFEYMSPEQAEMNAFGVDTRSDIYSLGVLLYELLTGTTPLEKARVREAALKEVVRLIKEEEPPRPSARLSNSGTLAKIAAARKTEPAQLAKLVRGELDWIVMKSLEKDRSRRYETANGMAQDVQRYLSDEPVQAGPPSAAYRLRKFAKRNRGPVTVATVVALTLLAGIIGTTWGWVDAIQARQDEADQRKTAVNAISDARDAEAAKAKAEEKARIAAQNEVKALDKARIAAQNEAKTEAARAEEARRKFRLVETRLALERGMNACARDQVPEGLLWLARGLELVPEDEPELRLSLRRLLAAWSREVNALTLKQIIPLNGSPMAISPNRKVFVEAFHQGTDSYFLLRDLDTGKRLGKRLDTKGYVHRIVFSPDSTLMATACHDEVDRGKPLMIRLWSVSTEEPVGVPIAFHAESGGSTPPRVAQMAFSGDAKRLVVLAGGDKNVRLWEVPTGKPIGGPLPANFAATAVFSPDSKTLLTAEMLLTASGKFEDAKHEVRFWDAQTGKLAAKAVMPSFAVSALAFSPDGKLVVCGGHQRQPLSGCVQVLETATGKFVTGVERVDGGVAEVAFAADGITIAVQCRHGIQLFRVLSQPSRLIKVGPLIPDPYPHLPNNPFAFSPNGQVLLTGGMQARLWDTMTAAPIGAPAKTDQYDVQRWWAAFDQAGTSVMASARPGILRFQIAQSPTGRKLNLPKQSYIPSMAFSPDGKTMAVAVAGSSKASPAISFFDPSSCTPIGEPIIFRGQAKPVMDPPLYLAYSPDGKVLLSLRGAPAYGVQLWDAPSRQPIGEPMSLTGVLTRGYYQQLFAFRSDGKRLLVADGTAARMLDTVTGKPVGKPLELGADRFARKIRISSLAFSPDGTRIVTGSDDGTAKVWNAETGLAAGPLLKLPAVQSVDFVAFSSDGRRLVTYAQPQQGENGLVLWNAETGQRIGAPILHWTNATASYLPPGLSPDGKTLLTRTGNDTARLWDAETGKPRSRNLRHGQINDMAFSPDGKLIVTAGAGGLRLWDVATGQPVGKPLWTVMWSAQHGIQDRVTRLPVFSPNTRTLLAVGRTLVADSAYETRMFEVPQPVECDAARLRLWVEVIAMRELDAGGEVVDLHPMAWQQRRNRLQELGGPPTP